MLDFCALDWDLVKARFDADNHPYTLGHQLPARCLEGLYLVLLLERGFGFARHDRDITYALEVRHSADALVPSFFISCAGPGPRSGVDARLRAVRGG